MGEDTAPAAGDAFPCGARIRHLRRQEGITLQVLADRAGISVGFLSQVERSLATPSLGTLSALARALGVGVDHFIANPRPHDSVTRANERHRFSVGQESLTYELLSTTLPGGLLTSMIVHLPPFFMSETASHLCEELVVVLEGQLRHFDGERPIDLHVGDTVHFMGDAPHAFANPTDAPTRLLWVGTTNPFKVYAELGSGSAPG